MCELLGVSVAPAASLGIYFHQFRPRAEENRDGWGIAWWGNGHPTVMKEPHAADESEVAAQLAEEHPASEMFIVHVRAATVGEHLVENTHPFTASALGRDWVFAHNGTVQERSRLDTGHFEQLGDTDSEQAFHHLLTRLEKLDDGSGEVSDVALGAEVLAAGQELSECDSRVNFLLSDGKTLYAYHDGHKTLHVIEKRADDRGEIGLADDDYQVSLGIGDAPNERAVVVASVPLTDEPGWRKLSAGDFLVIRAGMVVDLVSS